TAAGRLRTDLGCRPRLDDARRFALGHAKLLSRASAQQRAGGLAQQRRRVGATARRHHPNPAEAHRRWRGERGKPVRLGVRDHHTRSLCAESPAQTEQWCCWLCRRRIIFGPTCARGRGMLAAGPSCVSLAPQLKREWSPWPEFGWFPTNLRDFSKG